LAGRNPGTKCLNPPQLCVEVSPQVAPLIHFAKSSSIRGMVNLVRNPPAAPSARHVRIIRSVGTQICQTAHNATRHLDRALILLPRRHCTLHHHVLWHRTMVSRRLATNNSPLDRPTIYYWPRLARPLQRFGSSRRRLAYTEGCCKWILAFGSLTLMLSCILLVTMPAQQSYWAQVFPATILMSLCPDLSSLLRRSLPPTR
jgi:hypothetical protein